jgi:hypothetical protein
MHLYDDCRSVLSETFSQSCGVCVDFYETGTDRRLAAAPPVKHQHKFLAKILRECFAYAFSEIDIP